MYMYRLTIVHSMLQMEIEVVFTMYMKHWTHYILFLWAQR